MHTSREEIIAQVEEFGKAFRGKAEYLKYLRGERLTLREAVTAACYECRGYYEDMPTEDCLVVICPLRPFMPYVDPADKGVLRVLSDVEKAKLTERLRKMAEMKAEKESKGGMKDGK